MSTRLVCAALLCLPLAACELADTGTDPLNEVPILRIADAAHNGDQHFYFLPPLAWQPEYSGDFDATAAPEVTICAVNGAVCDGTVAAYNTTAEAYGGIVRAEPAGEFFHVNWHTDRFDLEVNTVYRIGVRVDGVEVGYLDVLLIDNQSKLRSGGRDDVIPLVNGRTAPIKFRIEQGLGSPNQPEPPTEPDPPEPPAIPEGAITGTVTDSTGAGIEGIVVSALMTATPYALVSETVTQVDGTYVLEVPETHPSVLVKFHDPNMVFAAEYHPNVPEVIFMFNPGAALVVARGETGIDAVLEPIP
jgi:hypothetical protein